MTNFAAFLVAHPARTHLTGIDWVLIGLYFGVLMCVAWWVVRKGKDTTTDYFLAGRNLGWWIIGASIFVRPIAAAPSTDIHRLRALLCFHRKGFRLRKR